jgi:hypothetical protein
MVDCRTGIGAQLPSGAPDRAEAGRKDVLLRGARSIERSYLACRTSYGHKLGAGTKAKVVNLMELLAALPRA